MTAPIASGWSESPGGACTHWKAPPCHGARGERSFTWPCPNGEVAPISGRSRDYDGAAGFDCGHLEFYASSPLNSLVLVGTGRRKAGQIRSCFLPWTGGRLKKTGRLAKLV